MFGDFTETSAIYVKCSANIQKLQRLSEMFGVFLKLQRFHILTIRGAMIHAPHQYQSHFLILSITFSLKVAMIVFLFSAAFCFCHS